MKLFVRISFFILVAIIATAVGGGFQQYVCGGFRPNKVKIPQAKPSVYQTTNPDPAIVKIFEQPFYYLDKGSQTYVFLSQDKQYVLKLVRYSRFHMRFWVRWLDFIPRIKKYAEDRWEHKYKRFCDSMRSYAIAQNILADKTDLIYVHLDKSTNLHQKVLLIDKLGRQYKINLGNVSFLLQRKADSLEKLLEHAVKQDNKEEFRKLMLSFFEMVDYCYKKHIVIKDYNCIKNAGFRDKRVINIDLGSFFVKENILDPWQYQHEFNHFTRHLLKWSRKKFPHYTPYIESLRKQFVTRQEHALGQI